jgi:uncharacterized protein YndB with AHSA1/START domain
MKPIDFELERTVRAPIDQVFARLVDIGGHNNWMVGTGSMLKHIPGHGRRTWHTYEPTSRRSPGPSRPTGSSRA